MGANEVDCPGMLLTLGVGDIKLKPTKSLRLVPCNDDTALGAANCVVDDVENVDTGSGKADTEALLYGCGAGAADWKSSKSSSAEMLDWSVFRSFSAFGTAVFPFEEFSFGGVSGGASSSNPRMSISGSFFFGGSTFLSSRFVMDDEDISAFLRVGDVMAPSSNSSYSSNRSLRALES